METEVNKITFFRSFYDAGQCFDTEDRCRYYDTIFEYSFDGIEPTERDPVVGAFLNAKPNIDQSIKNMRQGAINGRKGGAPKGNQNARKNSEEKTTPGLSENKTDKDKEKDKENGEWRRKN